MKEFYHLDYKEVFKKFETSSKGISESEAQQRILKFGQNTLPKVKQDTLLKLFLLQFKNPIIFILIAATVLSFLIGEMIDGWFILGIIIFNALLGTFQEWKAGRKAESLQNLIKVNVKVLRDGVQKEIASEQLVVGDVVIIESGVKISADLRLFDCQNLTIDEAVLTGESVPSNKNVEKINVEAAIADRKNMVYAGSSVFSGRGRGIVVATGIESEIGKIVDTVLLSKSSKSPLVIRMEKFTKQIAMGTVIVALIMALLLYFRGEVLEEIFFLVVALSVSAIPEGLPVVLTLVLTVAATRMARKNVLVKKLNAVESLGSCTVIATDKTGTLTANQQTAKLVLLPDDRLFEVSGSGYNGIGSIEQNEDVRRIALMGVINNEAVLYEKEGNWHHLGDSIDVAFLALGIKAGVVARDDIYFRIPYESENKYSAVFFGDGECSIKGSYEKVVSFCNKVYKNGVLKDIDLVEIEKQHQELAEKGYRVIALAQGSVGKKDKYLENDISNLVFLGLVAFIDPIREEVVLSIDKCRNAGIKVIMITGDHPLTAYAIASELSLVNDYNEVTDGKELDCYLEKSETEFIEFVMKKNVFSRVSPLQKLAIVNAYKKSGEFIAVTGDGVNDAPALKAANIGVAVGSGTDVAKETSTMIITDDNFLSLVDGIEEGRIAYSNIRKVILMLLSSGVAEVLLFLMAIILNFPLPLVAVQILWLNIVTNGIQDIALAFEKGEEGIMKEIPRAPNERIFNSKLLEQTFLAAIVMAIIVFAFWKGLIDSGVPVEMARAYVLLLMVFMQNVHVFNCRSEKNSLFKMKFSSNPVVFVAIFVTLGVHFLITQTAFSNILSVEPIPINHMGYVFVMALPIILIMELYKYVRSKQ